MHSYIQNAIMEFYTTEIYRMRVKTCEILIVGGYIGCMQKYIRYREVWCSRVMHCDKNLCCSLFHIPS